MSRHCEGKSDNVDVCVRDLREELIEAKEECIEVEILTATPPPAGNPPNIRGIIKKVKKGIIIVELTTGPPNRKAVFSICHIIGFVPFIRDLVSTIPE